MIGKDGLVGLGSSPMEGATQATKHIGWGSSRQVEEKDQKEDTQQSAGSSGASVGKGLGYFASQQGGQQTLQSSGTGYHQHYGYNSGSSANNAGASSHYKHSSAKTTISSVEADISAILRIIKHCTENYSQMNATGQLLGMEYGNKLEITASFQLPTREDLLPSLMSNYSGGKLDKSEKLDLEERLTEEVDKYQTAMIELMHEIRSDCFVLGWYQLMRLDDLQDHGIISTLLSYYNNIEGKNAVLLSVDPDLLIQGKKNAFKAFTLNSEYASRLEDDEDNFHIFKNASFEDILTEVPIYIKYPVLSEAFLLDWMTSDVLQSTIDYSELSINTKTPLDLNEKALLNLAESIDVLSMEQEKLYKGHRDYNKQQYLIKQMAERRRIENEQRKLKGETPLPVDTESIKKVDPPNPLPVILVSKYVESQCNEINFSSKESLTKVLIRNLKNDA
ncbi:eIF3 [Cryptosporidium canis]|nr:eIF3 [Cryptosporidium canis]